MAQNYDLVVVGGGPAGAVAARLAAQDGQRVVLIDPDRSPFRLEGVSPRLHEWLQQAGLFDAAAMSAIPVPRHSHWAGTAASGNSELIVNRQAMDQHLRQAARRAGVTVVTDSAAPVPGGAVLAGGGRISGRLVLDARGRPALRDRPRTTRGPATIAIGATLQLAAAVAPSTRIMPLDAGWLWLACPGGERIWAQLVLDAADPAGRTPLERLQAGLSAADAILPPGWQITDPPLIRDAAPVLPYPAQSLDVIAVGDAVAAMDPLSGHGMFWAVSSALAATAIRRTLDHCDNAASRDLALRFQHQRQAEVYPRQARLGRDFIRSETTRSHLPFWSRRAGFPDDRAVAADQSEVHIATRIIVRDHQLAEAEVLITPHSPAGIAWIDDQPAPEIFRAWRSGMDRQALTRHFSRAGAMFDQWLARQSEIPA